MRLALVVPALNEQDAIAGTLRRALAARQKVIHQGLVSEMTVVFVNDGSTDRTQQIVDQPEFDEVVKVRFEKNRGYGAAIKAGWQAADAELVGFIDADGTCDPDRCVDLLDQLFKTGADVVLAGRLNPKSEMPLVRRIGNIVFARLLGLVSGQDLTDSASGYRIVRRSSLRLMSPLPDGLHFTPAMSCVCLLDPRLKIEEVPLPYRQRIGRSKLSVIKDGLRFLFTILFSACIYSPIKTMAGVSVILTLIFALAAWGATLNGGPEALLMMIGLSGMLGVVLALGTGVAVHQLNYLLIGPRRRPEKAERRLQRLLGYRRLLTVGAVIFVLSVLALVLQASVGVRETRVHLLISAFLVLMVTVGLTAVLGGVIVRTIWAVGQKQRALIDDEYRVEPAACEAGSASDEPDTKRSSEMTVSTCSN